MTTPTAPGQLRRGIGVWGLAAAILNGMIGAGVFALAGSVAHFSGSWAPLVVLIVGLALLPVVLVFAALAGLFDETGGPILYVDAAFGPIAGFQTGWVQCLSTLASAAANANLLADYLLRVVPSWNGAIWHGAIVFAALGLALAINLLEARRSAVWLQRVSVGKLVPLAVLLALALPPITGSPSMLAAGEWSLPQAVLLSVYAFTGFEGALSIAGEAREPRRDFPRAMIGVFVAVAALYALLTLGYVATAYAPGAIDKTSLLTMAGRLAGDLGAGVIVLAAVLSIFGNLTANALFVTRRVLALKQLRALPGWFGAIRQDTGLPRNAILFTAAITIALALSGTFATLAVLSVAARLVVYLACIAALPVIRRQHGLATPRFGIPTAIVAAITCLWLIAQSDLKSWIGLGIAVVTGFVLNVVASQERPSYR